MVAVIVTVIVIVIVTVTVIVTVEVMLHYDDHLFPAGRKNRELEASPPEQEWMAVSANTGAPH